MRQHSFKTWAGAVVKALAFVCVSVEVVLAQSSPGPLSERVSHGSPADLQIRMWQVQVARDPDFWGSYNQLAAAYAQKARETGDISYLQLAESSLRQSLKLESTHADATSAFAQMATVHLAEHRFQEAGEDAGKAIELKPDDLGAYPYAGDAQLELGNYEASQRLYDHLKAPADGMQHPGIEFLALSHRAGLDWIKGDRARANDDLQRAIELAQEIHLPAENLAWTEFMLGEQYFQAGDMTGAEREESAALASFPKYHRGLAAMAQIRAAQMHYPEAIEYYKQAVAIIPLPLYLAALGDVYAANGDKANAEKQYAVVEFIGKLNAINQQVYNRELALFYADHDRKLPEALTLARKEFEVRHDVYTSDALAWALLKNGQTANAQDEIERALRLGTQDALMEFHAGMIYAALGDNPKASLHLNKALGLNPHFHVLFTEQAVRTLARVDAALQPTSTEFPGKDECKSELISGPPHTMSATAFWRRFWWWDAFWDWLSRVLRTRWVTSASTTTPAFMWSRAVSRCATS